MRIFVLLCLFALPVQAQIDKNAFRIVGEQPKQTEVLPVPTPKPVVSPEVPKPAVTTAKPKFMVFSTSWCQPCKVLHGTHLLDGNVRNLLADYVFEDVDAEANAGYAGKYAINSYPTLILQGADGRIKWRHSGVPSLQELRNVLQQFRGEKQVVEQAKAEVVVEGIESIDAFLAQQKESGAKSAVVISGRAAANDIQFAKSYAATNGAKTLSVSEEAFKARFKTDSVFIQVMIQ